MKMLVTGLDATTVAFLQNQGVMLEQSEISNPDELRAWFKDALCDIAVIDLEQSGLGIYVARGLRVNGIGTPIIGISRGADSRPWSEHRAVFLENGGDDLLRRPVSPRELIASAHALTRRFKGSLMDIVEYTIDGATLKMNSVTMSVTLNGQQVYLTSHEAAILFLLVSSPGKVFSKEMFLLHIYAGSPDDEPEMKIIDVFICKVRAKLDAICEGAGMKFIETVWGRGYRLPDHAERKKVA